MKVLLLDIYKEGTDYRISKDTNGSYGTGNDYGDGLFAKFLKKISKRTNFWPPLYLMYTGSVLREKGHQIEYSNRIVDFDNYDAIIMSSSIVCHETEINTIKGIKDKSKVIVIGSFASNCSKNYLNEGVKVIKGESEFYFLDNELEDLLNNQNAKNISNNSDITNLDRLPFPCWDLVAKYLSFSGTIHKKTCIPILAERGCPYSCFNYCTYPLEQGRKPRARASKNIVEEIKYWINKMGVHEFIFRDPVFSINRERTVELANMIIKEELKIKFTIEDHLNNIDHDLALLLKKAGVFFIQVGIESVDLEVMKDAKRFTLQESKEIEKTEMLRSLGIKVMGMYILGYETDTKESCLATIEYAKKLNTYLAVFSVFTPYPGTPIYSKFKNKIFANKYEEYNQWNPIFHHKNLSTSEIRKLLDHAFNSYYLNIKWATKNFLLAF